MHGIKENFNSMPVNIVQVLNTRILRRRNVYSELRGSICNVRAGAVPRISRHRVIRQANLSTRVTFKSRLAS